MNQYPIFSPEATLEFFNQLKADLRNTLDDMKNENDKPLSRKDAADFLGVDVSTLTRWSEQNRIKSKSIGNRRYYLKRDLLKAMS